MHLGCLKNWCVTAIMMLVIGVARSAVTDPIADVRDPKSNEPNAAPTGKPGTFFDVSKATQWSIKGKVLRLTPDGIFVKCGVNSDTSSRKPETDEVVFVQDPFPGQGVFKGLTTGSAVSYIGYFLGRLQNEVGRGIPKEVRIFELR